MEADAEVELEDEDGYTPMCVASMTDDPNCAGVVIHLVEHGADICKKCNGTLPYDMAANKIVKDVSSISLTPEKRNLFLCFYRLSKCTTVR